MAANQWKTPNDSWVAGSGIANTDLNRAEENSEALRDTLIKPIFGFGFHTSNDATYKGIVTVYTGGCVTEDGSPMKTDVSITKNLGAWALGNGTSFGGVVAGATAAAHTWLYLFIMLDPTTGNTELMIDDNRAGTNISDPTYTEKRLVNAIKTGAANAPTYDIVEMYSADGDRTYINPDSLLPAQHWLQYTYSSGNNLYSLFTLNAAGKGYLLPELECEARVEFLIHNMEIIGLVQDNGGVFSVPSLLYTGGVHQGEWVWTTPGVPGDEYPAQVEFNISSIRTFYLATYHSGSPLGGWIKMVPISFKWFRKEYGI